MSQFVNAQEWRPVSITTNDCKNKEILADSSILEEVYGRQHGKTGRWEDEKLAGKPGLTATEVSLGSERGSRSSRSRDRWTECSSGDNMSEESVVSSVDSGPRARQGVNLECLIKPVAETRVLPMRAEHEIMRMRYVLLKEQVARYKLKEEERLERRRARKSKGRKGRKGGSWTAVVEAEPEPRVKRPGRSDHVWTTTLAEVSVDGGEQHSRLMEMERGAVEAGWDGLFESFSRDLSP